MNSEKPKGHHPLVEHVDYYMEDGLMVFTESYHLKRGYCCGNGCRHCPYRRPRAADDSKKDRNG